MKRAIEFCYAISLCALAGGCSRDAVQQQREPTAPMHAPPPSPPAESSSGNLAVEESIRISCNLPNDEAKAPKFDYDEAALLERGKGILSGVARCLKEGPMKTETITLIGHADPRGSERYNEQLGQRRAEAARDYLLAADVPAGRMRVVSVGESEATGTDVASWRTDRRVEVRRGDVAP